MSLDTYNEWNPRNPINETDNYKDDYFDMLPKTLWDSICQTDELRVDFYIKEIESKLKDLIHYHTEKGDNYTSKQLRDIKDLLL